MLKLKVERGKSKSTLPKEKKVAIIASVPVSSDILLLRTQNLVRLGVREDKSRFRVRGKDKGCVRGRLSQWIRVDVYWEG